MARIKPKPTREEVLERGAQAAWEYCQRHRDAINAKARLRMQKRREALQKAPSDVQLEHAVRAAKYRRDYIERHTERPTKKSRKLSHPKSPSKSKNKDANPPDRVSSRASQGVESATSSQRKEPMSRSPPPRVAVAAAAPEYRPPRPRAAGSPSPKSLAAIDREESSEEDRDDSDEERGWEGDNERDAFGADLRATRHQDYIPQRGQQPFVRNGRTYWF
ncbi:hypothetical protein B0H13DRAFT_2351306 [Mycena leptocephala]|nr:hypothetical protein B0H13DRAFT_2351306 [Mycena leptocephala]